VALAQQAQQSSNTPTRFSPQASAWLVLLVFFGTFCTIVASSVWLGWRYYTTATMPVLGAVLRSHVNTGVVIQSRGQLSPSSLERLPGQRDPCPESRDICVPLSEGESVKSRREAGYGPVASMVLPDETHIQLWASPTGADLTLERYQVSQWNNNHQEVVLFQRSGYARFDLADHQPYQHVDYTVQIDTATSIDLVPGGSYSVYVPSDEAGHLPAVTADGRSLLVEVAVRKGQAYVVRGQRRVAIRPGEKLQVSTNGSIDPPIPAVWELIADSGFTQYRQQNMYHEGSLTWRQYWNENAPDLTDDEKKASFSIIRACRPETPDLCTAEDQVFIGQFRRDGGQTRPFTTGIFQELDVDVSEYTSLRLKGWVRVLEQSIPGTGAQGSECPIMIQLIYKPTSPTDQEQQRYICVYSTTNGEKQLPDLQVIRYRPVPPYTWYQIDIELRGDTLIKQARYLQTIRIEARGHDYLAEVTGFSMVGQQ